MDDLRPSALGSGAETSGRLGVSKVSPIKISVITPSFEQAAFLERTLQSVLTQDYAHVEYIVIDGGSTDGSREILQKYSARLAYWVSEKDQGQSDAIAKGFERATGNIFYWLNSDDILLPGALTRVARYFEEHPETEVVNGGAYYIDAEGKPFEKIFGTYTLGMCATYDRLRFYEQDGVFQPATFWRREAYEAVGGVDRSLRFAMDRDLFIRLAKRRPFARLPKMLACFRLHDESKSRRIQHVRAQETKILQQRYGANRYGTLVRGVVYYGYRLPSLIHKVWLGTQLKLGRVNLQKVS